MPGAANLPWPDARVGDNSFITCQRVGLADGARLDAISNAAGGHGAAKPEGVIHRNAVDRIQPWQRVSATHPVSHPSSHLFSWEKAKRILACSGVKEEVLKRGYSGGLRVSLRWR